MERPTNKAEYPRPDETELEMELATPVDLHKTSGKHGPGMAQSEHESEHAREQSRQQAMAARAKATRTHMPVGQSSTMHPKQGNQPRGGR